MKQTYDKIWEKIKRDNPDAIFIKDGQVEQLVAPDNSGFVIKCKAEDIQNGTRF